MPWDYPDHELWTLCEACHEEEENDRAELLSQLSKIGPCSVTGILALFVQVANEQGEGRFYQWLYAAEFVDLLEASKRRTVARMWVEDYSI